MNTLLELIGYWGSVTILTAGITYWAFVLVPFLIDCWIGRITKGKCEWVLWNKTPSWWKCIVAGLEGFSYVFMVFSFLGFIAFLNLPTHPALALQGITTHLGVINLMATKMTPVLSYVVIAVILFVTIDFLSRKGYEVGEKVKATSDKLDKE